MFKYGSFHDGNSHSDSNFSNFLCFLIFMCGLNAHFLVSLFLSDNPVSLIFLTPKIFYYNFFFFNLLLNYFRVFYFLKSLILKYNIETYYASFSYSRESLNF
jgi:hypothetical protein